MYFLSHYLASSRTTLMCEDLFNIGCTVPRLLGRKRLSFGPSFTTTSLIINFFSSILLLFLALLIADFITFDKGRLAFLGTNFKDSTASRAFLPANSSATSLTFLGDIRMFFASAITSI